MCFDDSMNDMPIRQNEETCILLLMAGVWVAQWVMYSCYLVNEIQTRKGC